MFSFLKKTPKSMQCTSWDQVPAIVKHDLTLDISRLKLRQVSDGMMIQVQEGVSLHLIANGNLTYRSLSICLKGHNCLTLEHVKLKGYSFMPPITIEGKGCHVILNEDSGISSADSQAAAIAFSEKVRLAAIYPHDSYSRLLLNGQVTYQRFICIGKPQDFAKQEELYIVPNISEVGIRCLRPVALTGKIESSAKE